MPQAMAAERPFRLLRAVHSHSWPTTANHTTPGLPAPPLPSDARQCEEGGAVVGEGAVGDMPHPQLPGLPALQSIPLTLQPPLRCQGVSCWSQSKCLNGNILVAISLHAPLAWAHRWQSKRERGMHPSAPSAPRCRAQQSGPHTGANSPPPEGVSRHSRWQRGRHMGPKWPSTFSPVEEG